MKVLNVQPNNLYMHPKCLDVCLFPFSIGAPITHIKRNKKVVPISAHWVNLGYDGNPWRVPSKRGYYRVYINADELHKWIDVTDFVDKKRLKPGLPSRMPV